MQGDIHHPLRGHSLCHTKPVGVSYGILVEYLMNASNVASPAEIFSRVSDIMPAELIHNVGRIPGSYSQ